jgi:hypothetical protein
MIKLYILLQHPAISYNLIILISSTTIQEIFPIIFIPFQSFVAFCNLQLLSSIAIQQIFVPFQTCDESSVVKDATSHNSFFRCNSTYFPQLSIVPFKLWMHPQY